MDKFDYTLHPESKKLIPGKAVDHIPKRITNSEASYQTSESKHQYFSETSEKKMPQPVSKSPSGTMTQEFEAVDISDIF